MFKLTKIIFLVAVATLTAYTANARLSAGEAGDSAYNKKNYTEALRYYTDALDNEGSSSNLYYNLGNTYYRMNDIGHAVLSYERALANDPSNDDARTNLDFVKSKIVNAPEDDSTFLHNLHEKAISLFSPDTWAWLAFAIFVIVIGAVAIYLFTSNVNLRKAGFFGAFILLAVFIYALIVTLDSASSASDHNWAVVTAPSTNLRSTPASSNSKTDKVVPVPEGTKVEIIDSLATPDDPMTRIWYEVKVNNTTRAWACGADIERI